MYSNRFGQRNLEKDVERALTSMVATPSFDNIEFIYRLTAAVSATDTTVTLNKAIPDVVGDFGYLVIDPYTVQCEIRKIEGVSGTTYTIAALAFAHAAGDLVIFNQEGIHNAAFYGAVGDGSTNDYAAIQACIDDMVDGRTFYLPPGEFSYTTRPIFFTLNNIKIIGDGVWKPSGCSGLQINDCETVLVDGLTLEATQAGNTYIGINVYPDGGNVRHCIIMNCHLSGFKTGIAVADATYTAYNTRILNNWLELTSPGLSGSIGILLEEPDAKVYNNTIQRYVEGIAVDAGSQIIKGNHIWAEAADATPTSAIAIRRGFTSGMANGFVISNNYLDGCFDDGHIIINVQAAEYITITANYFRVTDTMYRCIYFENGDTTWGINSVSIVGNTVVNTSGTDVSFTQYSGVTTNSSESFHIHSNAFRYDVTPSGTREDIRQTATYAASFTPNPMKGRLLELTLTGDITIGSPSNTYMGGIGNRLTFLFIQDGTGGWDVSWDSVYSRHWTNDGNLANTRSSITFEWDGTYWNQVGAQSVFGYEWIDYSSTSSITGWTSYTTQQIFYKKINKLIYVMFRIEGTSNDTATSFTVPTANGADVDMRSVYRGYDNGGSAQAWYMRLPVSSSTVSFYAGMGTTAWTNSGTKGIAGEFFYEIA